MDYQNSTSAESDEAAPGEYIAVEDAATIASALERRRKSGLRSLPIMDPQSGRLLARLARADDPTGGADNSSNAPRLGGMATPLGVYLTDGVSSGGVGFWGLALTGASLMLIGLLSQLVISLVGGAIDSSYSHLAAQHSFGAGSLGLLGLGLLRNIWSPVSEALPVLLVLICLRLLPLSGTHAAEHQVVHCVEQGMPLTPAHVRSMPRVHPRCGTNLLVGLHIFLLVFLVVFGIGADRNWDPFQSALLGVILAAPLTLTYWRRVGAFMQYWLATKPATDKQIQSAIRAAHEVLMRRAESPWASGRFRIIRRVWNMGFVQVLCGFMLAYLLARGIALFWPAFGQFLEQ